MMRTVAAYPYVLFVLPCLSLYGRNMEEASPQDLYRPLMLSALFAAILWVTLAVFVRNNHKRGILLGSAAVAFFTYGSYIQVLSRGYGGLGVHRGVAITVLAGFALIVFLYGFNRFLQSKKSFATATPVLNVMTFAVLVISIGNVALQSVLGHEQATAIVEFPKRLEEIETTGVLPNIYHIVLDAYARADVLDEFYQHDNTTFLNELRSRGFFVGEKSSSNYYQTNSSLSSMLNLQYHPNSDQPHFSTPAKNLIQHSIVRRFLERQGYTFVAFASGYSATEIRDADQYLLPPAVITEFERTLFDSTPVRIFLSRGIHGNNQNRLTQLEKDLVQLPLLRTSKTLASNWSKSMHRTRIRYILDALQSGDIGKGPTYVFAHIVCPHEPYVFDRNGNPAEIPDDVLVYIDAIKKRLYPDQVKFINNQILAVVDAILTRAPNSIILIHGDHGPRPAWVTDWKSHVRCDTGILNACFFPGRDAPSLLYDHISPVNMYRAIFNEYFRTDLPLLKDVRFVRPAEGKGMVKNYLGKHILVEEIF